MPYGSAIWLCHVALPYCTAICPCHMAMPYGIDQIVKKTWNHVKMSIRTNIYDFWAHTRGQCLVLNRTRPVPEVIGRLKQSKSRILITNLVKKLRLRSDFYLPLFRYQYYRIGNVTCIMILFGSNVPPWEVAPLHGKSPRSISWVSSLHNFKNLLD